MIAAGNLDTGDLDTGNLDTVLVSVTAAATGAPACFVSVEPIAPSASRFSTRAPTARPMLFEPASA